MKKALIITAHGSRLSASNEEVVRQFTNLNNNQKYDFFCVAFLELEKPSIDEALVKAAQANCQEIYLFHYFLSAGKHIKKDIPEIINQFSQNHPEITIFDKGYLGQLNLLNDLLQQYL